MRSFLKTSLALAALAPLATAAQSQTALLNFGAAVNIDPVTGLNIGGLDIDAAGPRDNGSEEFAFLLTLDDSADSGAIFNATLTLTGTVGSGAAEQIQTTGAGTVFLSGGATRNLFFTLSDFVETTSTGATLEFEGISAFQIAGANDNANFDIGADEADGGLDFDRDNGGVPGNLVDGVITLTDPVSSGPLTALVQRDTGAGSLANVTLAFNVTPVPEPASLALVGLGALSLVSRRRKA